MQTHKRILGALLGTLALAGQAATARDYITIVGSSTVYPFATVVAEQFGRKTAFKTPRIESTGSGGGLKLFCAGVGVDTPDISNASRRIKPTEQRRCAANGVADIVEIKIGYDGIVVANSRRAPQFKLSRRDLWLALARQVPGPDGRLIDNPYKTWKQIDPALPDTRIEVLGPPPTSGTRDAFAELVMDRGAETVPELEKLRHSKDPAEIRALMKKLGIPAGAFSAQGKRVFKAVAQAIREDGAYIEAGENDNLIVQKLQANPKALGVFGFSFLDQNSDRLQGSLIEGKAPNFDNIADGSYPVSRPLFFYVKKAHVGRIPGIREYIAEFTSDSAWGDEGYLADRGLIPMPEAERRQYADVAHSLRPMPALKP